MKDPGKYILDVRTKGCRIRAKKAAEYIALLAAEWEPDDLGDERLSLLEEELVLLQEGVRDMRALRQETKGNLS